VKEAMKLDKEFGNSWNDLGLVKREGGREGGNEGRAAGGRERKTDCDVKKYMSWRQSLPSAGLFIYHTISPSLPSLPPPSNAIPLILFTSPQYLWQEGEHERALSVLAEAKGKRRYESRYKPYLNWLDKVGGGWEGGREGK